MLSRRIEITIPVILASEPQVAILLLVAEQHLKLSDVSPF